MDNVSISDSEMLKYFVENGMINITLVQEQIKMQKRKEYLEKHPFAIWEDKNRIWHTYLPDKEKGRIPRKRNSKKEIENVIVEYWKCAEENPTVDEIFDRWLKSKLEREEISKQTQERYKRQYEQCFKDFGKKKIKSITEYDVEDFMLSAISKEKLTPKGFSNFRTLVFGIFKMAKKLKFVSFSITEISNDIEISKKAFRREKKEDCKQVFLTDEREKIINYLMENQDNLNLGILLLFKSGLRIGELAALTHDDIENNSTIHVCRTEIKYNDENGKALYIVRDFPKTEAGDRKVILQTKDEWILRKIKNMSPFENYLFVENGERIRTYVFRQRLKSICKKLGIYSKSPHKVRKTYGSILLDNNVPESMVISQMGHTDIKTTKEYYYRDMSTDEDKKKVMNTVSCL